VAANVTVIPPRAVRPDTLRVAAYCRVSSDSADQLHSYAAQIQYYTDLIQNHDGWDLVDVYADEGITGTRMDKREDFNRLLADCHKGKIDKVLVKSISRFARNTREAMVRDKYASGTEEAKKWGFVENTWEDKQFQEADWNAFVEKAMEGDPWEGHDGKQAF